MGTITRETTAPILPGEVASGTEIEAEFDKIVTLIGKSSGTEGNISNANIAAGAAIDGTKLTSNTLAIAKIKDDSVPGSKIADDTLTTAEFVDAAVPYVAMQIDSGTETLTTSTTYVDVPGLSAESIDITIDKSMIVMQFKCSLTTSSGNAIFDFNFLGTLSYLSDEVENHPLAQWQVSSADIHGGRYVSYTHYALSTQAATVIPRYKLASGSLTGGAFTGKKIFTVMVIPVKTQT